MRCLSAIALLAHSRDACCYAVHLADRAYQLTVHDLPHFNTSNSNAKLVLSLGLALEQGRAEGFTRATANITQSVTRLVERSNQLLVQDSQNAYIVLQPDQNGPFARSVNLATLRNEFSSDLTMGGLPDTLTDATTSSGINWTAK